MRASISVVIAPAMFHMRMNLSGYLSSLFFRGAALERGLTASVRNLVFLTSLPVPSAVRRRCPPSFGAALARVSPRLNCWVNVPSKVGDHGVAPRRCSY